MTNIIYIIIIIIVHTIFKRRAIIISPAGRPFSDNPKNKRIDVRLNQEEYGELEYCSKELNITKTGVIKNGIKKVKEEIDAKNKK